MNKEDSYTGLETAVIGMNGRFPGAPDIEAFWDNLKGAVESTSFFCEEELREAGVSEELLRHPDYVRANGLLEGIDRFDYPFFGYTPNEAAVMDPQMRIFHEAVWRALEDAGYDPGTFPGLIGLFAGASENLMWQALSVLSGVSREIEDFDAFNLNSKDFLSQRISYKLNLTGPSLTIYTACSTSLVAVHLACQSLITGECDMALAGGVTVTRFHKTGYLYKEGMVHSPRARCRAFDAEAGGIVGGDGAGVVVLRRLEEALEKNDHIYAVIRGSAVNNDGIRKVGFSASSVEGQAQVIRLALQAAEVDPESIGYVEAHGTGTVLGDPVEIEALRLGFNTRRRQYCPIGSAKTNVGHLDSAAGVAGFIKAVLCLVHRSIPPSLHFERPNPGIDFENSPFYVNTRLREWRENGRPLRAAVSSFGIGGTNAHVILEAAPAGDSGRDAAAAPEPPYLILLSARSQAALERMTANLARHFDTHPETGIADAAFTLQVGRRHFDCRRFWLCEHVSPVAGLLTGSTAGENGTSAGKEGRDRVAFMFPGQGSQYVDMGRGLYRREPLFRSQLDRCFDILNPLTGVELKRILYPREERDAHRRDRRDADPGAINRTDIAQPLLFAFEYALARLLMSWGISPHAMIGHSIGEYTAACLAGVFTLEDALKVVANRGRLVQTLPAGDMLGVPLSREELAPLLGPEVSLAAVNGPGRCVVSGERRPIGALARQLKERGIDSRRLHTSHAFHSAMMDPISEAFASQLRTIQFHRPQLPFLSNVTGTWITVPQAMDPAYWTTHLRRTVLFEAGLRTLLHKGCTGFVEVGPGNVLTTFAHQHPQGQPDVFCLNLVPHPKQADAAVNGVEYLFRKIGQLWLEGVHIDWLHFNHWPGLRRVPLPTYSFDGHRFPVRTDIHRLLEQWQPGTASLPRRADIGDWFYSTAWKEAPPEAAGSGKTRELLCWLVFEGENGFSRSLTAFLESKGETVAAVRRGTAFARAAGNIYTIAPASGEDYDRLLEGLQQAGRLPDRIIHCWLVDDAGAERPKLEELDDRLDLGLYSLLNLAQAVGRLGIKKEIRLEIVSTGLQRVGESDPVQPEKAAILGPVKIIPLEYPNLACRSIDIEPGVTRRHPDEQHLRELLWTEFEAPPAQILTAYRRGRRLVQAYQPVRLDPAEESRLPFKPGGVYLVIGGFGGMGFTLAEHLALEYKGRLALVGRSPFPVEEDWEGWLCNHDEQDPVSGKIRRLRACKQAGAGIMIFRADAADRSRMKEVIRQVSESYGRIDGVIHAAGVIDFGGVIQKRTRQVTEKYIAAKIWGTLILDELLQGRSLDFLALFSSVGNVMYKRKFGQVSYNAANEFLDAFAAYKSREGQILTVAIEWDDWLEVGMTVNAIRMDYPQAREADYKSMIPGGISPAEGIEVFRRVMAGRLPQVIVMTRSLYGLLEKLDQDTALMGSTGGAGTAAGESPAAVHRQERPLLNCRYVSPGNEVEQTLAEVWQQFFGIRQVGVEDDFFELGGDSLKALTLVNRIRERLAGEISLSDIMSFPTIRQLARNLGAEEAADLPECVVKLNKGGNGRNIFFIHPLHGLVYQYRDLAKSLEGDFNVFGIQARGVVRRSCFPDSLEKLVMDYLYQIRQVQPEGPYILGGYCFGDIAAYIMVGMMESMEIPVELLIMLDEAPLLPPRYLILYRFRERWRQAFLFRGPRPGGHSLRSRYERMVETIRRDDRDHRDDVPISPHEAERLKRNADAHINAMYQHYLKIPVFRKLPGIIRAPILDIKARDTKFRIEYRAVKRMSFGSVTLAETGGDHVTMLESRHAEELADLLRTHL